MYVNIICKCSKIVIVCCSMMVSQSEHSQQTVSYYMHTELFLKSKHELLICFWL